MNIAAASDARFPVAVLATLTLVVFMQTEYPHARGSAPSPEDIAQDSVHAARLERDREAAAPWEESLSAAFAAESDTALRAAAVKLFFLTTYKHRHPAPMSAQSAWSRDAKSFYKAWISLKTACAKAGLQPLDLADAIYRFTNSDWTPVSAARGPGLDKVKTPRDYRAWIAPLVAVGRKAIQMELEPKEVWNRQAASYTVRDPKDLENAGLQPPQPRF